MYRGAVWPTQSCFGDLGHRCRPPWAFIRCTAVSQCCRLVSWASTTKLLRTRVTLGLPVSHARAVKFMLRAHGSLD